MSITSLFTINEQESKTPVNNNVFKLNEYKHNLPNFSNTISICIKALQLLSEITQEIIQDIEFINGLSQTHSGPTEIRKKKVNIYYKIDKAMKIVMEFRKTFCLSEEHPQYNELKIIDQILEDININLPLVAATYKLYNAQNAKHSIQFLLKLFTDLQKDNHDFVKEGQQ